MVAKANNPATVVCPTCQGAKVIRRGPGKGRLQACLACSKTGRVEPWRVCPRCRKWAQACICHEDQFRLLPARKAR